MMMTRTKIFSSDKGSLCYDDDEYENFYIILSLHYDDDEEEEFQLFRFSAWRWALYVMMMTRRVIFSSEMGSLYFDDEEEDFQLGKGLFML